MDIIKIAGIALLGVMTALLLKEGKQIYSLLIGLAVAVFICMMILNQIVDVTKSIESIWKYVTGNSNVLPLLFRMIGITYIADLTAGICKESGYQVLSNQVTLAGKIGVLLTGFPILMELVDFVLKIGKIS